LLLLCVAVIALAVVGALVWFNPVTPQSESVTGQQITVDRENIPSIAVLPFDNLSVDPEQGYFADGISEDLITDLSKIKHLFVIARNSSFAFKGKRADIADIAKELGVRYVLEGSVRRSGDRVRINAQLVDSHTLGHLWADRFERPVAEVFEFQDQVIRSIVDALSLELSSDEDRALFRPQTDSPEAYDAFLRGQSNFLRFTNEQIEQARIFFRSAIELDPTFARAYSAMSVTYSNAVMNGAADDPDAAVEHAIDLARSAIALDSLLPQPHFALGYAFLYQREFEQAIQSVEGALARAPSYADAHMLLAFVLLHAGQVEKAFAHIELGKALNPQLSMEYLAIQGQAHYWAENYAEAADSLERALARNPAYALQRLYYAAVLTNLDRLDEAEWEAQEALALNPSLSIAKWLSEQPFKDAAQSQRMAADLSRAGLE
jgi:adenylate cyclase